MKLVRVSYDRHTGGEFYYGEKIPALSRGLDLEVNGFDLPDAWLYCCSLLWHVSLFVEECL